jgi:hypothetical protein
MVAAARIILIVCGLASIAWGVVSLPSSWRNMPINRLAFNVISGSRFAPGAIETNLGAMDAIEAEPFCQPAALRSSTILRLALAEDAVRDGERLTSRKKLVDLRQLLKKTLLCAPVDPFLWFALYYVDLTLAGISPETLKYMELSYRFGPFEGWIGAKRNRFALGVFDMLPENVKDTVILEFALLVDAGFVDETSRNLEGPGWAVRTRLLAALDTARLERRRDLAKRLRYDGYEVVIPGVKLPELRPWD